MTTGRSGDDYEIVKCGGEYADAALAMLRSILAELARDGREEYYCMSETDDEFRALFHDPEIAAFAVKRGGTPVAFGAASFCREEAELFAPKLPKRVPLETIGYVEFIQVASTERGKGLQPALFEALEAELRRRGAAYFTGIVSPRNRASLGNFLKRGYQEVGRTKLWNGFDRLLMAKEANL